MSIGTAAINTQSTIYTERINPKAKRRDVAGIIWLLVRKASSNTNAGLDVGAQLQRMIAEAFRKTWVRSCRHKTEFHQHIKIAKHVCILWMSICR